jgi:hypothetical protein
MENDLKGKVMQYSEMGNKYKVRVLEHRISDNSEFFKLGIIEILAESPMFVPSKIGDIFEARRTDNANCGWDIYQED